MCALGKGWEESEQGRKRGIEENRGIIKSTVGAKKHGKKLAPTILFINQRFSIYK